VRYSPHMSRHGEGRGPPLDLSSLDAMGAAPARRGPTLLDWAAFVASAVRRRPLLFALVASAGLAATAAYYLLKVPLFRVEARVLAQRQQALPGIVHAPGGEEAPQRSAWDLVHRRDNLVAIIKQAGLLDGESGPLPTPEGRLARLRGAVGAGGAPSRSDDPLEDLVRLLDRELIVTAGEGSVTIHLDWPDRVQALKLVEAAVQNFLEARHVQEITIRDEAIALLQGRVASLREQLDRAVDDARRQLARRALELPVEPRVAPPPAPSEELVRLRSLVEAKERAIGDVEEFRRRRLADLQAQLDLQRGIYSSAHPAILALNQDIRALSAESPQVVSLREELRRLREDYSARHAAEVARGGGLAPSTVARAAPLPPLEETERVRQVRFEYQQMVERTSAALLDLDNARAGFKYRYDVVWPARAPREPFSPRPLKVLGGGAAAAILLALVVVAASVLREGRVIKEWQLEHSLDLPVLGRLPKH